MELYVTPFLPIRIYTSLIDKILKTCERSDGDVAIELVDFALRLNIITAYSLVELPDDVDVLYYIVYCSDLYDTVAKNINQAQFNSITSTIKVYLGMLGGYDGQI